MEVEGGWDIFLATKLVFWMARILWISICVLDIIWIGTCWKFRYAFSHSTYKSSYFFFEIKTTSNRTSSSPFLRPCCIRFSFTFLYYISSSSAGTSIVSHALVLERQCQKVGSNRWRGSVRGVFIFLISDWGEYIRTFNLQNVIICEEIWSINCAFMMKSWNRATQKVKYA